MENKWLVFIVCIFFTTLFSGCKKGSDSGDSVSSGATLGVSDVGGGEGGAGVTDLDTGGSGDVDAIPAHNPEPVTMALFGSGLVAFAISKRKKKAISEQRKVVSF